MCGHAAWPVHYSARRRRYPRRLGALVTLAAILTVVLPADMAEAAVRTSTGMRGTVLGRTAWYGLYLIPGVGPALCLDADKAAPDTDFNYRPGQTITGTLGAQLAYAARVYGSTSDIVTAVAAKLVVHDLQGARYPYGELDVFRLQTSQLAGFGGREASIVTRARQVMNDVLTNYRIGPYRLTARTPSTLDDSNRVPVTISLLDGRGRPFANTRVTLTATNTTVRTIVVTTDSRGQATATFTATDTGQQVRITASTVLPSPTPTVYWPTRPDMVNRAQRVVIGGNVPAQTTVTVTRTVEQQPDTTVTVTVNKSGDVTAYHPITGAQFELHAETPDGVKVAGPVTVGADGTATFPAVVTTDLGSLWLVETTPPPGYTAADPIAVPLAGTPTVAVADEAQRGTLTLVKRDAQTGQPLAGALLRIRYDADGDGTFETDLGTHTTTTDPVPAGYLLPGRYEITEEAPPPGYQLPADARQVVTVEPGGTLTATFDDHALTTIGFRKQPAGVYPAGVSLAGATFVVRDADGREAGRCTTDATGGCTLPEQSLVAGQEYCWEETTAPPGFTRADGGCFTAPARAQMVPLVVIEQGEYTVIEVDKRDADDRDRPLADATYALTAGDTTTPLATGTTGPDGIIRFTVLPGAVYCVREVRAPAGYQLDPARVCTPGPVSPTSRSRLTVYDQRTPEAPATPAPSEGPELPYTGAASAQLGELGAAAVLAGVGLLLLGVPRRRGRWPHPVRS